MSQEWAVRNGSWGAIMKRKDRLDAENSARMDRRLEIVSREVTPWQVERRNGGSQDAQTGDQ